MSATRLPSSERVDAFRLAGRFVCSCGVPFPRRLGVWQCSECSTCGKLILATDAALELLERMIDDGTIPSPPALRIARFGDGSEALVDDTAGTVAVRPSARLRWSTPAELEEAP